MIVTSRFKDVGVIGGEHRIFEYLSIYYRSKIELGDVTPHNIKQLKLLNQVVFPVSYNEKFYKDVLEAGELAKLAYYNDIVVIRPYYIHLFL